jgi:hypothetical protein
MSSDLVDVFLLSLVSMLNPTLLAAVTLMLLLPHPKRLMLGYVLGAYTTSITCGVLIVFSLQGTSTERAAKHRVSPLQDIFIGMFLLLVSWVLRTRRDQPFQRRRHAKKDAKLQAKQAAGKPTESLPTRLLRRGDPKITFVVGAMLSFPGVSYLLALDKIHGLDAAAAPTVLLVIFFCVMQQMLLELPLLGYLIAPNRTRAAVDRFREMLQRRGRGALIVGAAAIGSILIARGVLTLL